MSQCFYYCTEDKGSGTDERNLSKEFKREGKKELETDTKGCLETDHLLSFVEFQYFMIGDKNGFYMRIK